MPHLHLLIPEPALREAVTEQLKIAKLDGGSETGLPDRPPSEDLILVLDEAACDGPTVKKLQMVKNEHCFVLLLGQPADGMDDLLITEIFEKPIRLGHLLARLRYYLEVAPRLRSKPLAIGPYQLDAQKRSLTAGDTLIRLTEKETALLEYLAQSPEPVGRDELLAAVWGYDARIDTHTLETHIYQLRRKLGTDKNENTLIINEGGLYRLGA